MPLSPIEEKGLPAIRSLIAAAVRASVAQSEDEAMFLIEDIDEMSRMVAAESIRFGSPQVGRG